MLGYYVIGRWDSSLHSLFYSSSWVCQLCGVFFFSLFLKKRWHKLFLEPLFSLGMHLRIHTYPYLCVCDTHVSLGMSSWAFMNCLIRREGLWLFYSEIQHLERILDLYSEFEVNITLFKVLWNTLTKTITSQWV